VLLAKRHIGLQQTLAGANPPEQGSPRPRPPQAPIAAAGFGPGALGRISVVPNSTNGCD